MEFKQPMEMRNVQHSYKYTVDLHPTVDGVAMDIFEIQILLTQRLANAENIISVLFRAHSEGDVYVHEWYNSWHDFPEFYKDVEAQIQAEIDMLKYIHPEFREGYQPRPLRQKPKAE